MNKKIYKIFKKIKKNNKLRYLPLHEPFLDKKDKNEIQKCLKSSFVSTAGKQTILFENKLKKYTKSKYVICVNSGTSAIHIALLASSINSNDEVLVPTLTFVGTVNPILYVGASPHFVDCEKKNLGIDFDKLEDYLKKNTRKRGKYFYNKKTKKRIRCIIPVHVFGHSVNVDKLKIISKKFNLTIIEDAAEALGSFFKGKHLGTLGHFGVLSFNGNKIITTGCGGAILTNNKKLFKIAKHISNTSKKNHPWNYLHDKIGFNYRMPALNASLGLSQINKINKILKYKRRLFKMYKKNFQNLPEFKVLEEPENSKSNYWLQTLIIENAQHNKEKYIKFANQQGIQFRPVWNLLHKLDFLKKYPKMNLSNSSINEKKILSIPSGNTFRF